MLSGLDRNVLSVWTCISTRFSSLNSSGLLAPELIKSQPFHTLNCLSHDWSKAVCMVWSQQVLKQNGPRIAGTIHARTTKDRSSKLKIDKYWPQIMSPACINPPSLPSCFGKTNHNHRQRNFCQRKHFLVQISSSFHASPHKKHPDDWGLWLNQHIISFRAKQTITL